MELAPLIYLTPQNSRGTSGAAGTRSSGNNSAGGAGGGGYGGGTGGAGAINQLVSAPAEAEEAAVYMEASGKTDWQTSLIILLAEAEEAVAVLDRKIMEPEATVEGTTRMERPALWERV